MRVGVQAHREINIFGETQPVLNVVVVIFTQQSLLHGGDDKLRRQQLCKQASY